MYRIVENICFILILKVLLWFKLFLLLGLDLQVKERNYSKNFHNLAAQSEMISI